MEKELRSPPSCDVNWSFYHRTNCLTYHAVGRTAWAAVKSLQLSFQECDVFVEGAPVK